MSSRPKRAAASKATVAMASKPKAAGKRKAAGSSTTAAAATTTTKKAKTAVAAATPALSSGGTVKTHAGRIFAITGTLSRVRRDIIKLVEAAGGKVRGSVTADVTHLIAENPYLMTGKMEAAKARGVHIVSESFLEHGKVATVYDSTHVTKPDIAKGVEWQYEEHAVWKPYDAAATPVVETAYQDWCTNKFVDVRAVKSGTWIYQVDFNKMTQMNAQHTDHTVRNIKRIQT